MKHPEPAITNYKQTNGRKFARNNAIKTDIKQ